MTKRQTEVTAGPWKVKPMKGYTTDYIVTEHPDFQTKPHGNYVGETGLAPGHSKQRFSDDANFIVAAVNACFAFSPEHPELVPPLIEEAFEIVKLIHEAHRPYREELVLLLDHRASTLLARLSPTKEK